MDPDDVLQTPADKTSVLLKKMSNLKKTLRDQTVQAGVYSEERLQNEKLTTKQKKALSAMHWQHALVFCNLIDGFYEKLKSNKKNIYLTKDQLKNWDETMLKNNDHNVFQSRSSD